MLARLQCRRARNLLYSGAPGTGGFSDVKQGGLVRPYVAFAKRYGIANGYLDGTFRPEQPVSRAELVKLIASYFTVEGGTSRSPMCFPVGGGGLPLRRRRAGCRAIRTAPSGPARR